MTNDERMTKPNARKAAEDSFWDENVVSIVREEPNGKRVYDLEERTARFGEAIIDFAKMIPQRAVTNRIISQVVAAGTSVGENYVEADDAVSKKEFLRNIGTCKKEARETKHHLRMTVRACPELKPEARSFGSKPRNCTSSFPKSGEASNDLRDSHFGFTSSFVFRHFAYA
jgi:four helix bundle protein